jgi:hypothetical protein
MVLLRQCFAEGEAASFSKTRKILERRLYDAGERDLLAVIKEWQRAHAKLLNKALDELVQERMAAEFCIGFAVLVEQALGGQSKDELRGWDSNPQPTG